MSDPSTAPDTSRRALRARIEVVLDAEVRPELQSDGNAVELVGIDADHIVQVRLLGACQVCSAAIYPLTMRIESAVKARVPEVRFLEAVP